MFFSQIKFILRAPCGNQSLLRFACKKNWEIVPIVKLLVGKDCILVGGENYYGRIGVLRMGDENYYIKEKESSEFWWVMKIITEEEELIFILTNTTTS